MHELKYVEQDEEYCKSNLKHEDIPCIMNTINNLNEVDPCT